MIREAAAFFLDMLYPGLCGNCGGGLAPGEKFFCGPCKAGASEVREPLCTFCGRPFLGAGGTHPCFECMKKKPAFDRARAPAGYEGIVKEAIHVYKYRPARALKGYLGDFIEEGAIRWF